MSETNYLTRSGSGKRRYFKPRSYRKAKEDNYWRKKFIINLLGITIFSLFLWFVGLKVIAGLDNFWDFLGKNSTEPSKINEDKIPPPPPFLTPLNKATREKNIDISGYAENESEVELFRNEKIVEKTVADNEGKYSFDNITLERGSNLFFTKAKDKEGNVSENSQSYTITTIDDAPEITLTSPQDGDTVKGKANQTITVSGKVSPSNVNLTVNDNLAIVNENGEFYFRMSLTKNGENEIQVKATDEAGNQEEKKIKIFYEENAEK